MIYHYYQSKIYMIWSPHTDKVYIGGTKKPLSKRFSGHKGNRACLSREIIDCGDAEIKLICLCPCYTKEELEEAEGKIMVLFENRVNVNIPGRGKEQQRLINNETRRDKFANMTQEERNEFNETKQNNLTQEQKYKKNEQARNNRQRKDKINEERRNSQEYKDKRNERNRNLSREEKDKRNQQRNIYRAKKRVAALAEIV